MPGSAASGWRMVFLVNVPVGVVALVAGQYLLPRGRERHPITAFDWAAARGRGRADGGERRSQEYPVECEPGRKVARWATG